MSSAIDAVRTWYDIIDDFHEVRGLHDTVLIPRDRAGTQLHVHVHAAIGAMLAGVKSVDWVVERYVDEQEISAASEAVGELELLSDTFRYVRGAMAAARGRLVPLPEGATPGEFAASVALERLPASLKSAHLLYRMGHRVDGDTVARSFLEQVAWALEAAPATTNGELGGTSPTRSVTGLKKLYPSAGLLYGVLSRSAHRDVVDHMGDLFEVGGRTAFFYREGVAEWATEVMLRLGDMWLAVWEASQVRHLASIESLEFSGSGPKLRDDRPYSKAAEAYTTRMRIHTQATRSGRQEP